MLALGVNKALKENAVVEGESDPMELGVLERLLVPEALAPALCVTGDADGNVEVLGLQEFQEALGEDEMLTLSVAFDEELEDNEALGLGVGEEERQSEAEAEALPSTLVEGRAEGLVLREGLGEVDRLCVSEALTEGQRDNVLERVSEGDIDKVEDTEKEALEESLLLPEGLEVSEPLLEGLKDAETESE